MWRISAKPCTRWPTASRSITNWPASASAPPTPTTTQGRSKCPPTCGSSAATRPTSTRTGAYSALAEDISSRFGGVRTLVTNDANAATIGEMVYGNAKGMRDFVMVTLGTGLGSGFVANGEMIYGHDGFAGELGHIIVERHNGRECGCGRYGCLETYVSATGIKRTAFELMAKMSAPSRLRDIAFNDFDASMISAAAEQGDPVALECFRFTGEMLGRALADVATITSPEAIFLFGGLSKAGKFIFEPTQWYMEENMLFVYKNKIKLLPSGIQGKNAAILGASALIWQAEK